MVRKYIPVPIKNISLEHKNLLCQYMFKKGKYEGHNCYIKVYSDGYCKKHFLLTEKIKKNKIIMSNKIRCKYNTINGTCNRICKNGNISCDYHKKIKKENHGQKKNKNYFNKTYIKIKDFNENDNKPNEKQIVKNIDFSNIFEEIKQTRNRVIIENNLHIFVLKDTQFQNEMFNRYIGIFNEYTKNDNYFNKMIDLAIKHDIVPFNFENNESLTYTNYKNHLLKTNIKDNLGDTEKLYIEKYLEFVFKCYNYVRYNKIGVSKEDNYIKNILLKFN